MKKFAKIFSMSLAILMTLACASIVIGFSFTAKAAEPIQLTISGTSVSDKEYDGTTGANVTIGTVEGIEANDKVTVEATAEFENKNVGLDKDVTVTYKISGNDADKYLAPKSDTVTASINPKQLIVMGTTVAPEKVYDGTTSATVYMGTAEGIIAGDDVKVDAVATFEDKNAGEGKSVTIEYTLTGSDYNNYTIDNDSANADIIKRSVTFTSADASKGYDGTPLTNNQVTVTGLEFVDGEGATFDCMGSQTPVGSSQNFFEYTLNQGTSPANYAITTVNGTLTVTPNNTLITITANDCSKKYDGTPLTDSGYKVSGNLAAGDYFASVTVEGSITNVGSVPNIVSTNFVIYNQAGDNVTAYYMGISTVDGTLTITPNDSSITITADSGSKTHDGTPLAENGYTVSGTLVEGHYFASVTVQGSITDVGSVPNVVTSYIIRNQAGEDVTAYYSNITTVNGTLTIDPEQLPPATGDTSNILLYVALAIVSMTAVVFTTKIVRKETNV